MAIVFQGALHTLNPVQRVGDQIGEAIELHSPSARGGAVSARVGELLELVGLPARRARDYPHQLSGGQRQRVLIGARARVRAAAADRRRADDRARRDGAGAGAAAARATSSSASGWRCVFITHDLSTLAAVCRRIAVMYAGRIVEEGPSARGLRGARASLHARAGGGVPDRSATRRSGWRRPAWPATRPTRASCPPGCPFHPRCPVGGRRAARRVDVELWPAGAGARARPACTSPGAPAVAA